MAQQYSGVKGVDFTLPAAPPLVDPPLSLLSESKPLIDLAGLVARRQQAVEMAASAQEQLEVLDKAGEDISARVVEADVAIVNARATAPPADALGGDLPSEVDSAEDARKLLEQEQSEWRDAFTSAQDERDSANAAVASLDPAIAALQRWEHGFLYLPELTNAEAMSIFVPDGTTTPTTAPTAKTGETNQPPFGWYWYDPFQAVSKDQRSSFGWPNEDYSSRALRAQRSLDAHEAWQVEQEFWTGAKIPTNYHLTASKHSKKTGAHRTLTPAFTTPTAAPGTVLGTAASLSVSLAALDQAIADSDAGVGMIHATPYVVQSWSRVFTYLRDSQGNIRSVNNNLIVPGYGYAGTGPDQANRTITAVTFATGATSITKTGAAFSTFDLGHPVTGPGIAPTTFITKVTSATKATLSAPTTSAETAVSIVVVGSGGRATGSAKQWAYATETTYHCQGDAMTYPHDLREMSPNVRVTNNMPVRVERSHAIITNRILRAAVLVDTTTT